MQYTKASELLKAVKEERLLFVEEATYEATRFLCNHIHMLNRYGALSGRITALIQADLDSDIFPLEGKNSTYPVWLSRRLRRFLTYEEAYEARLQYLDALINYYESQGD